MTDQATAAAIEPRPTFDQQVSVLVTGQMKAFLRGAVADGPAGLKEADVVRNLMERGMDSLRDEVGPSWVSDMIDIGRRLPPVTRER
jgi:hypothetical protein